MNGLSVEYIEGGFVAGQAIEQQGNEGGGGGGVRNLFPSKFEDALSENEWWFIYCFFITRRVIKVELYSLAHSLKFCIGEAARQKKYFERITI